MPKGAGSYRLSVIYILSGLLLFLFVGLASRVHAQAVTGNISGTVTDASGGVIAGANIQVKNTATGVTLTTVSNDQGRYNVPDLTIGTYDVQASNSGFQTVVQTGVSVTVGNQHVVDFSLPVGQAQQTVTVESAVAQVETQSTAITSLVSAQQMADLPLNGRNFEQLLDIAPGVTKTPAGTTALYGVAPSYSIAGARTEGTAFLLDYTNMADFWNHQAGSEVLGTSLGVEAIQEFSMLTNTYSSQFGGNGAVMNAASKSGTNDFHGSAYEYLRNSALDSRSYFDLTPAGQPYTPPFRRNQFGGSVGGPIKRNKLFFFANYEGFRQALGQTVANVGVPEPYLASDELPCGQPGASGPTAAVNTFSPVCAGLTPAGAWPAVGTSGNPIEPEAAFGSGAAGQTAAAGTAINGILGLYNKAFTPPAGAVDQGGYYFTTSSATQVASENYGLGRMDYTLSANDSIFGRYFIDQANNLLPLTGFFGSALPYWPEVDHTKNQFLTIQERHIFSSNVVNNARFLFTRTYESSYSHSILPAASDPLNFNPSRFPEDASVSPLGFTITGIGSNQFVSDTLVQNTFGAGDDVAWNHGAHTVTFGADILRVQSNLSSPFEYGGDYPFSSLQTFLQGIPGGGTGYAVANSPFTDNAARYFREIDINPYINDSWKVSSRLTLNLGVRYEYGTNPSGWPLNTLLNPPYGNGGFSPVSHVFQTSPNRKNIDPRLGLAWAPFGDQKTSIRAGFGIFHDPVAPRTYASAYYFDPPFNYHQFPSGTMSFPDAFFGLPAPLPPQDEPTACAANNVVNNSIGCTSLGDGVPFNTQVAPYQEQWNLNIQRELGRGTILTVGYVGSRGVHLFAQENLNPSLTSTAAAPGCGGVATAACATPTGSACIPTTANLSSCVFGAFVQPPFGLGSVQPLLPRVNDNYGPLNEAVTQGSSNYNSLQVSLVRQAARGITMQLSYTYSHCLSDADGTYGLEEGATGLLDPYDPRYDYGNCSFDLRHNFVGSVVYQLPFHGNRLVEGWRVSGIFTAETGLPFSISDGFDQAGLFNNVASTRPDVTPGCNPYVEKRAPGPGVPYLEPQWINSSCFALEPVGTLGNAQRDTLLGPRLINLDFSLIKDTKITERLSAQFRAEFFNIANRTDFAAPNPSLYFAPLGIGGGQDIGIPSPTYGWITATVPNSQREIQFAVRLLF
ncbi:MAG TPA: carboxypeptidase regulatory-like domain-containing protein [Candidatus Acidoferrales bacterium]